MSEPDAQLGRRLWGIADAVEHCTDLAIDDVQAIRDAAQRLESRPSTSGQEISEETVKIAADAIKAKRRELIARPLAEVYPDLARAVLQAAQKG